MHRQRRERCRDCGWRLPDSWERLERAAAPKARQEDRSTCVRARDGAAASTSTCAKVASHKRNWLSRGAFVPGELRPWPVSRISDRHETVSEDQNGNPSPDEQTTYAMCLAEAGSLVAAAC